MNPRPGQTRGVETANHVSPFAPTSHLWAALWAATHPTPSLWALRSSPCMLVSPLNPQGDRDGGLYFAGEESLRGLKGFLLGHLNVALCMSGKSSSPALGSNDSTTIKVHSAAIMFPSSLPCTWPWMAARGRVSEISWTHALGPWHSGPSQLEFSVD